MKWNGRTRCALVCVFFALLFSVFSYRLIHLQMVMHNYYSQLAAEKNVGRNVIPAERGAIYDARHEVLAQNVPVATVVADGTLINNNAALIPLLATSLHVPPNEIAEKIASRRRYIVLKREFPKPTPGSRENLETRNCEAFAANAAPSGFIPTGRCSVTSSASRIFSSVASRAWKRRWINICGGGRLSLHRARRAGSRNRPLPRAGTCAAQRVPGPPDDRHGPANHRRK